MPAECIPTLFEYAPVEGRHVVAAFDGGAITSDAGALLLGETDRAIRLTERFATCFTDARMAELVEHEIGTVVLQRVVGIALDIRAFSDCLESRLRLPARGRDVIHEAPVLTGGIDVSVASRQSLFARPA